MIYHYVNNTRTLSKNHTAGKILYLFLKIDTEGYEQATLRGASNALKEARDINFPICTYHRKNDAGEIAHIFQSNGFAYEQANGYIFKKI
jgi:hypothetical protein